MEGSASPGNIIQFPGQHAQNLHKRVSSHLSKAGHPATPQTVNPDDQSPLEKIEEALGDPSHAVGSTIEEVFGGTGDATHVRTAKGKVSVFIALKRRFLKKAA